MDNRHPADELAEIRNEIRELKERENELRNEILALPPVERQGRRHTVHAVSIKQRRLDPEILEKEFGDIRKFYREIDCVILQIRKNK